jgi:hypothetical protein
MRSTLRNVSLILVFLAAALPLCAQGFSWGFGGGLSFFGANYGRADPPAIVPFPGFSAEFGITELFSIELTEDIYFHDYEYNFADGYAMACNPENRSAFVLGFMTGVQPRATISIGKGIDMRFSLGFMADLRVVTLAFGLNHPDDFDGSQNDAKVQTDKITEYFWGEARWLFGSAGVGIDFPINESFLLGVEIRSWLPVYRIWTDRGIPPIDGYRFGLGFRITPRSSK